MAKRSPEVVSIRLPAGMADELRAVSRLPLSTLTRNLLQLFLNSQKRNMESKTNDHLPDQP